MDGGDILYFVLLGFFLLSGLLKKLMPKKKDEKQMPTAHTPIETIEDFDDWYNKLDEEPEIVVTPEIPKNYFNPPPVNYQHDYQTPNKKAVKTTVQATLKNDYANEDKIEIELDTAEDARKAFIYSEIFQRKY
ncbi:hypothetical protein LJB95_03275 [Paludibacteraceae bacterium OttesenSCG-928-F17]|nr:hypothetical protein [Paludibacteraceae bacterium OttesenSCG-928-F17]MDL2290405.1 hypothetical protein [Paludibacteraceae bacterium OttesenSCG-928-F17]